MLYFAALFQISQEVSAMSRVLRNCRVSVSLTSHEKDVLERIADESGLSLSRVIQEAVTEFIGSHEGGKLNIIGKNKPQERKRK